MQFGKSIPQKGCLFQILIGGAGINSQGELSRAFVYRQTFSQDILFANYLPYPTFYDKLFYTQQHFTTGKGQI